jgi:predicted O-linked N-acetylglucosamine transferase (SPINDLY family)
MTDSNQQSALSKEQIDSVIALYSSGQYQEAINQIKILNESHPNTPFLFNLIGACYKSLGQLEGSAKMFETAVNIKPDYAEAHKNLGITLKDIGQLDAAAESLNKAIAIDSNYLDAHYNLAITLKDLNQLDAAVKTYQKVIEINPNFAQAYNNLGNLLKDLGQNDEALKNYNKAIEINPNFAHAHNNLGNVFKDLGQLKDAVSNYKKAIERNPDFSEAHNNLGNAFKDLGELDNAIKSYQKAVELDNNLYEAYYNLGVVLIQLKRFNEAIQCFQSAIEINPNFTQAFNNLGSALMSLGRLKESINYFKKSLDIDSEYVNALNNLGIALTDIGQLKAGAKSIERAIEIDPDFAEAHNSLGNIFKKLKKIDKALLCYERAYAIKPEMDFVLGSILNLKMHLCIWDGLSSQIDDLTRKIGKNEKTIDPFNQLGLTDIPALQRKATEIRINSAHPKNYSLPTINPYEKHSKIRIGYFSADFKIHPVTTLTTELYEVHDRNHFEIHAFSYGPDTKDEMNLRIKAGVDYFHNVEAMSHKDITLLARSLEIDIAVDLTGYTAKSRTDIFAMSAAPIQLSYIGYLGTMGADYYDYLIADPVMIPKENQKYYVEKIVYLPSFQVNDSKDLPPEITLTRKDVGLPEEGFVFCCFNNTYKFTPTIFDSWARILSAVDNSVLIVFANNELSKTNLTKELIQRGVKAERLIFGDSVKRPEYLARYRTADLFLDTHPYNAGTTASDALKMGLPLLTMIGKSFNSREAASILTSINLPELITNTPEEYEALAIELASNPDKLKAIKDKLTSNLSTAPLYDTKLFTKNIESAYTEMYERHHKGLEPDHIYVEE